MKKQSKNILITGVSSGIGYAAAKAFVNKGYKVFGSVRKESDGDRVQSELGNAFTPLIFDVTDTAGVDQAKVLLENKIGAEGLACLINNSGIAEGGPILHQSMEDIERHMQVNVMGLIRVTKAFLPLLGAQKDHVAAPGKIVNISSVSGKFAFPFVSAYVASKHAVEGFSQGLRRELLMYGVDVIIVGPGSVQTPIWDKGTDMSAYVDTDYAKVLDRYSKAMISLSKEGLEVDFVGEQLLKIHESNNPKTRYALVKGKFKNWIMPMLIPDRTMDGLVKKQMKM